MPIIRAVMCIVEMHPALRCPHAQLPFRLLRLAERIAQGSERQTADHATRLLKSLQNSAPGLCTEAGPSHRTYELARTWLPPTVPCGDVDGDETQGSSPLPVTSVHGTLSNDIELRLVDYAHELKSSIRRTVRGHTLPCDEHPGLVRHSTTRSARSPTSCSMTSKCDSDPRQLRHLVGILTASDISEPSSRSPLELWS